MKKVHISIISHDQEKITLNLLESLAKYCYSTNIKVTVTANCGERFLLNNNYYPFNLNVIKNNLPLGFGKNHNKVLLKSDEEYFCIVNPDVTLVSNPFPHLFQALENPIVGIVGPAIFDSHGNYQDSARLFPSPWRIFKRTLLRCHEFSHNSEKDFFPDWIAGMFMLLPGDLFRQVQGFDEKFYLYCEDADLCFRVRQRGLLTQLVPRAVALHDARRSSHRSLRYLLWHLQSLQRFFRKHPFYSSVF